ncbi:MAG: hypothetical protein KTR28_01655 [Micavibrio sp.]|nr:hypothetical protein [Micavibrio sp.]
MGSFTKAKDAEQEKKILGLCVAAAFVSAVLLSESEQEEPLPDASVEHREQI